MRKAAVLWTALLIAALIAGCSAEIQVYLPEQTATPMPSPTPEDIETPVQEMEFHAIDVGQGDSLLIRYGDACALIDAGPGSAKDELVTYLNEQGVERIDLLVFTHPHEDHIGGGALVVSSFEIGAIYMPKVQSNTKTFENLLDAVAAKGLKINSPRVGDELALGDVKFTVLAPLQSEYKDTNDYSIVLRAVYGETAFMLTGDAEKLSEKEILASGLELSAQVLKAGHHGSSTSSYKDFVEAVNPSILIISCSKDNKYGHPHKETLDLAAQKGIDVLRTDEMGTIVIFSDGKAVRRG